MLKPKLPWSEQGFTLVEVLISILIISIFIAASMQSLVFAAYFKARAKEFSEAVTWIQEDLENVKYAASSGQLAYNPEKCNAGSTGTGFADSLQDNLPALPNSGTKNIAGKSYTLTRTSTFGNVAPFEVLRLTYSVAQGNNPAVTTIYTEVIPDAAFQCP